MHTTSLSRWTHQHVFLGEHHGRNERRIWLVVALTAAMMGVEIVGGTTFGSLALVADGWHMSTHAAALAISASAYLYARRHLHDERFAFGTGKFGELASFASAIILAVIALAIGYESIQRLLHPVAIAYDEAIAIAVLGLGVNLASAWLLGGDHSHGHSHNHDHAFHHHQAHDHQHETAGHRRPDHDLNLRAAYVHVLADALTSVLAICGLLAARFVGWSFMDPIVGLIGALVILSWSYGLLRSAGAVLLDTVPDQELRHAMRTRLEQGDDRVVDQHLWQIGPGHCAAVVTVVSHYPQPPAAYKARLADLPGLSHVTIEVETCSGSDHSSHEPAPHDHHVAA